MATMATTEPNQLHKPLGLSCVPDDLAAKYPDLLINPVEHAQLFKVKYAGVFTSHGRCPARIEAMRTEQWGQLDLRNVLSLETYIDMADYDEIETIRVYSYKDDCSWLCNEIRKWPIFRRPFISPEGWKSNADLLPINECEPDDRLYWPIVVDVTDRDLAALDMLATELATLNVDFDPATLEETTQVVYTVEWRSGVVTLMPIDMVKIHLYTELPDAPVWLDSHPGATVRRSDTNDVVPESAVVERWYLCKERKRAAEMFDAFVGAFMPPKFELSV